MTKIAILGDTHIGHKKGSLLFSAYFEKFFADIFFPYLLENNISVVIQEGDCFDSRRNTQHQSLAEAKRFLFDKLKEYNITFYTLVGNHDTVFKDTLKINSQELFLKQYENIRVISEPTTLTEYNIDVIPWICKDNEKVCFDLISNPKSPICIGHFEIANFSMHKGIENREGLSSSLFSKYHKVFSGHFHTKSLRDNIYYTNIPYELTYHDYNDEKGFHIFDTETYEITFIPNPYKMYYKVEYSKDIQFDTLAQYKDSFVKVFTKERTDDFEIFLDHLNAVNPFAVSIVEETQTFIMDDDSVDETESTISIVSKYIDGIKNKDLDTNKLKQVMIEIYTEAMRLS